MVEVGYTPGYEGAYEDDGTVVYGTGCNYDPWCGDSYYYGWGWSWGYGYVYVPWYGCWVWRDWWDRPGAPRYGVIDNIYDRWREGDHVVPHDRAVTAVGALRAGEGWGKYPAVYGRFQGSTRPAALIPPANTLALNPYARPQGTMRPGEIPHGAAVVDDGPSVAGRWTRSLCRTGWPGLSPQKRRLVSASIRRQLELCRPAARRGGSKARRARCAVRSAPGQPVRRAERAGTSRGQSPGLQGQQSSGCSGAGT